MLRFRFRFRFRFRSVCFLAALLAVVTKTHAQTVTVQGRVIEAGAATRISNANVELAGVGNTITNRNGVFLFPRVTPGSYTLNVRALGYQSRELTLAVNRDTTLTVELEVAPLAVDSLVVRTRTFTLRGTVDDSLGRPIIDADVTVGTHRTLTNLAGSFKAKALPAGVATSVQIGAIGFEPLQLVISAQRDTSVRIRMVEDPIGQRILAAQIDRLVKRSSAAPYARLHYDRIRLARAGAASLYDFLAQTLMKSGSRNWEPRCLMVDDMERAFPGEVLRSYLPDEFERIEVFDKGLMVRLYTRRYVARLQSREKLPPILIVTLGSRPMCQ